MSGYVEWIGAQAEEWDGTESLHAVTKPRGEKQGASVSSFAAPSGHEFVSHSFPVRLWAEEDREESRPADGNLDLWLYRDRTVGLLRRYLMFSLETGRLPSIVGREFFRAKVSSYRAVTFEDRVIFVHDVEKCLERLGEWDQKLIGRVILQEYSHGEAAYMLHCCRKTLERRLLEVLDLLSESFLKAGLLVAIPPKGSARQ